MNAIDISKLNDDELAEYLNEALRFAMITGYDPDDYYEHSIIECLKPGFTTTIKLYMCDCGALKTVNPNCHSHWCSTQS